MSLDEEEPGTGLTADRPVKKRASQACHHCRTRKVKCDLVKSGPPCHNCSADGIECVITESRRSRKYRLQKRQLNRTTSVPLLPQTQAQVQTQTPSAPAITASQPVVHAFSPPAVVPATISAPRSHSSHDHASPSVSLVVGNHFQSPPAFTSVLSLMGRPSSHRGTTGTPSSAHASISLTALPSYIRPAQREYNAEDLEYLTRRGAFSIPEDELRDQLLRSFILYVYPLLPVVDLEAFIDAIEGNPGSQISLLLFQAVMFAGTAFVDLHWLNQAGFSDRRPARAYFFNKIKLLYDFDWEADRPTVIQAILLHAYWYLAENEQKDPWHWLGVCISLATSFGLDQRSTVNKKDARTSKLWRRLWWACFLRDRVMAISMRKPMRLKDEDFSTHTLSIHDFETTPFRTSIPVLQDCVSLLNGETRTGLAELCIAKIKLLIIIGRIMRKLYVLQGFAGTTADPNMLYTPKKSNFEANEVFALQEELDAFTRTLPLSCRIQKDGLEQTATERYLHLHRSVLNMIFWLASEALHRPMTLIKGASTSKTIFLQQKSRPRVTEAAEKLAEVIQSLREQDMVRFLPPLAVAFMLPAIASFLVEIKSMGKSLGDLPGHQFHHCVRALLSLRDIWPIADSACFLVGQMITNSQIGTARTLGMQATPAAVDQVSASSREGSTPRPSDDSRYVPDEVVVPEVSLVAEEVSRPEIPGVAVPVATELDYSPGNMGNEANNRWGDQFQFPWTMNEFGFSDSFMLDDNDIYADPVMGDYNIDPAFNHGLMDFNPTDLSGMHVPHDVAYPTSTPAPWPPQDPAS